MKSINEKYVPSGWTKTTVFTPSNPIRESWPKVEGFDSNILGLFVENQIDMDDDPTKVIENTTLIFQIGQNEIVLVQHVERSNTTDVTSGEKIGNEFTYDFKVIDHKVNSIMTYKVELVKVEINQEKESGGLLGEKLEVISKLEDDEENPFETSFEDPES